VVELALVPFPALVVLAWLPGRRFNKRRAGVELAAALLLAAVLPAALLPAG
jgi:hypothetical protein